MTIDRIPGVVSKLHPAKPANLDDGDDRSIEYRVLRASYTRPNQLIWMMVTIQYGVLWDSYIKPANLDDGDDR